MVYVLPVIYVYVYQQAERDSLYSGLTFLKPMMLDRVRSSTPNISDNLASTNNLNCAHIVDVTFKMQDTNKGLRQLDNEEKKCTSHGVGTCMQNKQSWTMEHFSRADSF
jgi:hypothetical protein